MKHSLSAAALTLILLAPAFADVPASPANAGPPLGRFDPCVHPASWITRVFGNPRTFTAGVGYRIQRIPGEDRWLVDKYDRIEVVGINRQSGAVETRETINATGAWCLSPDGGMLFACRESAAPTKARNRSRGECFNFKDGRLLWQLPDDMSVNDACFTIDGKSVVVMTDSDSRVANNQLVCTAVVVWFDAATGKELRRMKLPGQFTPISGELSNHFLAADEAVLYVTQFNKQRDGQIAFAIHDGANEPVPLETGDLHAFLPAQVRIGGPHREWVVFHSIDRLVLYQNDHGKLTLVRDFTARQAETFRVKYERVQFSPDGSKIFISTRGDTLMISTTDPEQPVQSLHWASQVADFIPDGDLLLFFNERGGSLLDFINMREIGSPHLNLHPEHCGAITDVAMSDDSSLLMSTDGHQLMLWSKDGDLLAHLTSPVGDNHSKLRFRTPLFIEKSSKILAADGWNFLEWDLTEIQRRIARKPDNTPRVVGKIVYQDRKYPIAEPELMDIAIDPSGTHLATATRLSVFYRSLNPPGPAVALKVPADDIMMSPRAIYLRDASPDVLAFIGGEAFVLDSSGKEKPQHDRHSIDKVDSPTNTGFTLIRFDQPKTLIQHKINSSDPNETMDLPPEWANSRSGIHAIHDSRWIIVVRQIQLGTSAISVIDWQNRKIVGEGKFSATPVSIRFSPDGKYLLVGATNHALYLIDFARLRDAKLE